MKKEKSGFYKDIPLTNTNPNQQFTADQAISNYRTAVEEIVDNLRIEETQRRIQNKILNNQKEDGVEDKEDYFFRKSSACKHDFKTDSMAGNEKDFNMSKDLLNYLSGDGFVSNIESVENKDNRNKYKETKIENIKSTNSKCRDCKCNEKINKNCQCRNNECDNYEFEEVVSQTICSNILKNKNKVPDNIIDKLSTDIEIHHIIDKNEEEQSSEDVVFKKRDFIKKKVENTKLTNADHNKKKKSQRKDSIGRKRSSFDQENLMDKFIDEKEKIKQEKLELLKMKYTRQYFKEDELLLSSVLDYEEDEKEYKEVDAVLTVMNQKEDHEKYKNLNNENTENDIFCLNKVSAKRKLNEMNDNEKFIFRKEK